MENIGDRQYGFLIEGDVFYTIPMVESAGEIAKRFYEGFKSEVLVLDVTNNVPVGIGWELDGSTFVDDGSGGTVIGGVSPGQNLYAFIANSKIFGMIEPRLSDDQKEMFSAAFATGGVLGVDVT